MNEAATMNNGFDMDTPSLPSKMPVAKIICSHSAAMYSKGLTSQQRLMQTTVKCVTFVVAARYVEEWEEQTSIVFRTALWAE